MENTKISEDNIESGGHKVISPMLLLNNEKNDITNLLNMVSKKYKVSIKDAAFALTKTLEKF